MMKIDVLCRDGSPLGVVEADINGEVGRRIGVGGAELALLTMCAAWKFHGHAVRLYNSPREYGRSTFEQYPVEAFNPQDERDVLIIFRSPNPAALGAKGLKVWWSCDQFTIDDYAAFGKQVNKIVTISKYHSKYFLTHYGLSDTVSIDLPVRTWEYKQAGEKHPKQCLCTSMPDRGVKELQNMWGAIVAQVPDAQLVITSDWRLWAEWAGEDMVRPYKLSFARLPNVTYLGAVRRPQLVQLQLQSSILTYPCTYEEMFCIAAAEAQVAGMLPITSDYGALSTTNMGVVLSGNPQKADWQERFIQTVVERLNAPEKLQEEQCRLREIAMKRFSLETILDKWYKEVFTA